MATLNSGSMSEQLWIEILRTHNLFKLREDHVLSAWGLTSEQFRVLMTIGPNESSRVIDMARQLTRSANSVSMIVDRMVKSGLLKRVRDNRDRRVVHVSLTKKARGILGPAIQADEELARKVFSEVSLKHKDYLIKLLKMVQSKMA